MGMNHENERNLNLALSQPIARCTSQSTANQSFWRQIQTLIVNLIVASSMIASTCLNLCRLFCDLATPTLTLAVYVS